MSLQIILMGPQGSGKGTVADLLKLKLGLPHISMGDLLRDTVKLGSQIGIEIKKYIDKGELVPLDVISKMLLERLGQPDCKNGYILDGFPRDRAQAEVLDKIAKINSVIVLEAPMEVLLKRLGGRIQCRSCGAVYNKETIKPKVENVCDVCQGELYQREDDKDDAIRKRLSIYETETKPLIERYSSLVLRIDTSSISPEEVSEIIIRSFR